MRAAPLLLLLAGCALPVAGPPRDLVDAARTLARAEASPFAAEARREIAEAEEALTSAEQAQRARPGSQAAADDAYVALRMAEKAVIAGRYAAERTALEKARAMAERLSADLERRDAFFAGMARRRAAEEKAQQAIREIHRKALARVRWAAVAIEEQPSAILFRLSAETLFLPGTSLLRDGGEARLAALAAALRTSPPCLVRLQIQDDVEGFHTGPALLAERRRNRVHDVLCAYGVAEDAFLPYVRRPPPGTQIDVLAIDPVVPLPADDPGPAR